MRQTAEENITEVHFDPDCPVEQVTHVLSALDRWRGRTGRQVMQVRGNDRHDYRTTVIIEPSDLDTPGEAIVRQVFHVPTRNVSKAGLGFAAPAIFVARRATGKSPLVRTESVFQVGAKIKVKLGLADGKMPTLRAEITRLRPVCFGFFDVGVRFVSREP